jgi:hypothetical protein
MVRAREVKLVGAVEADKGGAAFFAEVIAEAAPASRPLQTRMPGKL